MVLITRTLLAVVAVLALATACTNPFAPDDDVGAPQDRDEEDGGDEQRGVAPIPADVHFG